MLSKKVPTFWKLITIVTILAALSLALASCRQEPPAAATVPPVDAKAVFTAAAQTAQALMTQNAENAATPTETPTATPEPETPTPTVETTPLTVTVTAPALTATTAPVSNSGSENAVFVEDRSVPDGTEFEPGDEFLKTWRLMNTGSATWTNGYSLARVGEDDLEGPESVPMPLDVPPNQVVDISVNLTAPQKLGTYKSNWRMRNPAGQLFGDLIYVEIKVVEDADSPEPTETSDDDSDDAATITQAIVTIDSPDFSGECPHTYSLTASFTLSKATEVTYQFEAGSDIPGFEFDLPSAVTDDFASGTHSFPLTLDISNSGSGWIRLHITDPQDILSNRANFDLECD